MVKGVESGSRDPHVAEHEISGDAEVAIEKVATVELKVAAVIDTAGDSARGMLGPAKAMVETVCKAAARSRRTPAVGTDAPDLQSSQRRLATSAVANADSAQDVSDENPPIPFATGAAYIFNDLDEPF